MAIIGCTTKLLSALAVKPVPVEADSYVALQSWHANLLEIKRQKCILLVNDATLFNFIIPQSPASLRGQFIEAFKGFYACVLAAEGFDEAKRRQILSAYDDVQLCKTSSRKIIGAMNDFAFLYQSSIDEAGGLNSYQVPEIIKNMNRVPCKGTDYQYPIDRMQQAWT